MIKRVTHAHLGSIWYHSEPSDVPYSPNQFLGWDFFCRFLQQTGSNCPPPPRFSGLLRPWDSTRSLRNKKRSECKCEWLLTRPKILSTNMHFLEKDSLSQPILKLFRRACRPTRSVRNKKRSECKCEWLLTRHITLGKWPPAGQRRTTWADMRLKTSTEETFKKKLLEPSSLSSSSDR